MGVIIDDVEVMAQILSNLPEEYKDIVENLEDRLNDNIDMLTIKIFWDNLSANYNRMNARSNQTEGKG